MNAHFHRLSAVALAAGMILPVLLVAPAATAGGDTAPEPRPDCDICQIKTRLHEAAPWFKIGLDARYRFYHEDNRRLSKMNPADHRAWQRLRTRLSATIIPFKTEDVRVNTRMMYEARYWHKPDVMMHPYTHHETLLDRLNVEVRNLFGHPVTVTAGRQNLKFGDGWLVFNGTPRDGSRTGFFDAIRLTCSPDDATTADLIYIHNKANSSTLHRPIDDRNMDLSEQDESGVIAYLSRKTDDVTKVDGYFIYKRDQRTMAAGNNSDIYTIGSRVERQFTDNVSARVEVAGQWGRKNRTHLGNMGANARVTYAFRDNSSNSVHLDYEYHGGDSRNDGAFDPLWGRHAQWSPLYNDSVSLLEEPIDYSPNFHRIGVGWLAKPLPKTTVGVDYMILVADRNPNGTAANFSNHGKLRGHLAKAYVKYKIDEHVQTRILCETFFPGSYYSKARNDIASFFQWQVLFAW